MLLAFIIVSISNKMIETKANTKNYTEHVLIYYNVVSVVTN